MIFRIVSDLHLEFGALTLPILSHEDSTTLLIAGDLGLACKPDTYLPFLFECSQRFARVLWVFGNHEYYKDSWLRARHHAEEALKVMRVENVHILENEAFEVGDVTVLGCTMWTTMNHEDPLAIHQIQGGMNDYRMIRFGPVYAPYQRPLPPEVVIGACKQSKGWLRDQLQHARATNRKALVVTHHAPSPLSIAEERRGSWSNDAYVEPLDELLFETKPQAWVHGHMHHSFDYEHPSGTRILCNPRGYFRRSENPAFDLTLRIAL